MSDRSRNRAAVVLTAVVLAAGSGTAYAGLWPVKAREHLRRQLEDQASRNDRLEDVNAALRRRNHRLLRRLGWRERQVRRLHRANRERIKLASGVAANFMCIHFGEGSWTDKGAPYWGGLQMDMDFQRTYGMNFLKRLGTADHWPPFVQIAVAMSAYYSGRGYHPWPQTSKACGL